MTDDTQAAPPERAEIPRPDEVTRFRSGPTPGPPIQAGDHVFHLAPLGLARSITEARDGLYDEIEISGKVAPKDIRAIAWMAITANYALTPEQTIAILEAVDARELMEAVVSTAFVHESPDHTRTYTNWARSALIANGLDPATVSKDDMPHVLHQLVATGRAIAHQEFTAAAEHANVRREILKQL